MNPFSGLALATPALAVFAPAAIAALVYAYRRYGRGERKIVGTLLLLKALQKTASVRRTFKPPPRFFLEAALLSLLVLGGAGLYRENRGTRIAVVIDDSMSMAAVPAGESSTVLDQVKSEALSFVDALSDDDQVFVVRTSEPAPSEAQTINAALDLIENITPTHSADNLEPLLTRLGSDARFDRIAAFTDRRPIYPSERGARRIEVAAPAERPTANFALTGVSLTTAPNGERVLKAEITSFSAASVAVTVRLSTLDILGEAAPTAQRDMELPAHGGITAEFADLRNGPAAYHVTVEPRSPRDTSANGLRLDDAAWISAAPPSEVITVVSDLSEAALGLDKLRHLRFHVIRPSEWNGDSSRGPVIFHRFSPEQLPARNAFFILPPPGGVLGSAGAAQGAEVTRWNVADPLNAYLNMPALTFKLVTPLELPPWGRESIATTEGIAAFSGTFEGQRFIAAGFELFPYEGAKNRILSILTLNALGWLADTSTGFEPAGATYQPLPETEFVHYPGGENLLDQVRRDGEPIVFRTPGFVTLKEQGSAAAAKAINFFDEGESNIAARPDLVIPNVAPPEADSNADRRVLSGFIAGLALVLLLIDLYLFAAPASAAPASEGGRR